LAWESPAGGWRGVGKPKILNGLRLNKNGRSVLVGHRLPLGGGRKEKIVTLKSVNSSLLSEVGYDADLEKLTVIFKKSGGKYVYSGVPQETYNLMMAAESLGGYFLKNIKPKFAFRLE